MRSGWAPPRRALAVGALGVAAVAVAVAIGLSVLGSNGSSEQFRAALGATSLAPGANGSATLTKTTSGWRIELDASGLPRLDNGPVLRGLAEERGGRARPDRDVQRGPEGHALVGRVAEGRFTTLTVTRERADGDQASSGQKVLVGPVEPR